jgi:hypothetical protein
MKLEFSQQIFQKYSKIKFHEKLPSEMSHSKQTNRWTDMMQVTIALHNFMNAPNYQMNFD